MNYICRGCHSDLCSLVSEGNDFDPLFCPFDKNICMVKWEKYEGKKLIQKITRNEPW